MKTKTLAGALAVITLVVLIFSSCEKTIVNDIYDCECPDSCLTEPPPPPPPACTETRSWTGYYAGGTPQGGINLFTNVADSTFINGGISKLANSPYAYYFSGMWLEIPSCRNLAGDSIRFDARVKNPVGEGAIEQLDVALAIYGESDTAFVNFIGRAPQQSFTGLGLVGQSSISNVPELVQLFTDYQTASLEIKNNVISAYKNGTLLKSYNIPSGKKIGKVRKINLQFKGTGSVDWIKIFDNAGNMKLKEEFNTNKKSTVEWY